MTIRRIEPGPGQESVWDYPRPPRGRFLPPRRGPLQRRHHRRDAPRQAGPRDQPPARLLHPSRGCPHGAPKPNPRGHLVRVEGLARYFDVEVDGKAAAAAAWYFPLPTRIYDPIKGTWPSTPAGWRACFVDASASRPRRGTSTAAGSRPRSSAPSRAATGRRGGESRLPSGSPCGNLSSMTTTKTAVRHPLQGDDEEDRPMKPVQKEQTPG